MGILDVWIKSIRIEEMKGRQGGGREEGWRCVSRMKVEQRRKKTVMDSLPFSAHKMVTK